MDVFYCVVFHVLSELLTVRGQLDKKVKQITIQAFLGKLLLIVNIFVIQNSALPTALVSLLLLLLFVMKKIKSMKK